MLEIRAVSYSTTESCCDIFCGACDNQFDFCLRHRGTGHDGNLGICPLGSRRSGEIDGSSFSFGSSIGGLTNPMRFTGSVWPVSKGKACYLQLIWMNAHVKYVEICT